MPFDQLGDQKIKKFRDIPSRWYRIYFSATSPHDGGYAYRLEAKDVMGNNFHFWAPCCLAKLFDNKVEEKIHYYGFYKE